MLPCYVLWTQILLPLSNYSTYQTVTMNLADGQLPATTHDASQVYSVPDIESDECTSERARQDS
ncbi:hypothetical protein BDZ85DRAFT_265248 [Elsinoe ampelina]|uniref:Uncharacterized protein n=1 Tax=Elsinoe ampelina TaxID=302913 RepID=A0A6A6G6Q4_9PEZI|nr:hypothetical protein BDZ85DRAFT_265248 [Elsinoe ampelina]